MIELKEVSKFYSNNGVTNIGLHNINLKLNKNEIVAITGESGSGKSTLLNVISKIDTFDEGEILYYGNETSYFSISDMDDFRKNKVGFIFQNYNIIDSYTVLDNVMIPFLLKGLSKDDARVEAMLLIKKVGLDGREKHRGSKLSGGEKQRCVIARALAGDCDILACDEPTGNLDSQTALEIIKLIKEVAKDKLVLIVTHNYPEVEGIATRLLKMADGKIVEDIVYEEKEDEAEKELELDYQPLDKKVIWRLSFNNIIRTPKKTVIASLMYFIIAFCFLFIAQLIGSLLNVNTSYTEFNNTFENRLFVYGKNGTEIDESLLKDYDYELNDFASELSYMYEFNEYTTAFAYASHPINYKLVEGRTPESEDEFVLLFHSSNSFSIQQAKESIGEFLVFELNNGFNFERFKLVGVGTHNNKLSTTTFAAGCPKLQKILNIATPEYSIEFDGYSEYVEVKLVNGNAKPTLYIPADKYESSCEIKLFAEIYEIDDFDLVTYSGESIYLEMSIDKDNQLKPYFASVYSSKIKIKKLMSNIEDDGLQVVYPIEYTNEDLMSKLLLEFLSFIIIAEFSVYLIGIFFIVYVILGRVYRSRIKDYSILRTLGVTKKDMAKVVNIEMLLIGFGMTIVTYLIFNGLIYSMDALSFLRKIGVAAFLTYFIAMFIFSKAMAKRFNKRLFKFTVRESVRGDDDND